MTKITKKLGVIGVSLLLCALVFANSSIASAQFTDTSNGSRYTSSVTSGGTIPVTSYGNISGGNAYGWSGGCISIPGNLYMGMRGNSAIALFQNFLISMGYLGAGNATGYFGPMTYSATANFQNANNISPTGLVGPLTRNKINSMSCNGGTVMTPPMYNQYVPVITSMSPGSGAAGTIVTLTGTNFTRTNNSINFGGTNKIINNLESYDGVTLRFTVPSSPCADTSMVCPAIAFGAGQFPVSVTTSNGTSNSLTFTLTNSGTGAQAPVLSGVAGPTSIAINQTGTWSVTASDPRNGVLNYNVSWGDEAQYGNAFGASPTVSNSQTSSFTHSYGVAGVYTIRFTVTNSYGLSSTASLTINVTGNNGGGQTNYSPVISYITPTSGRVGTLVTVYGQNLGAGGRTVSYANMNNITNTVSSDGTMLQFTIPDSPCGYSTYGYVDCSRLAPGQYPIRISTINGSSNTVYFTLTDNINSNQSPVITSLSPSYGPFGTMVTITGTNFASYGNSINFAGVNRVATNVYSSNNGTQLQFTIPATPCSADSGICAQVALGSGSYPISVNNGYSTSNALTFTVPAGSTNVNQYITLALNQTGNADGVEVTPLSIVEDSRCPVGVYCIQAGRVSVSTNIRTAYGSSNITTLSSDGEWYTLPDGHKVKITSVTPTKYQSAINSYDYRITYFVTR